MKPASLNLTRGALCATLSAALYAAMQFVTPLGFIGALVSPLPIAYMVWAGPLNVAVPMTLFGAAIVAFFFEPVAAAEYLAQFALGGYVVGYGIRKDKPPQWTIGFYALLSLGVFAVFLAVSSASTGLNPLASLDALSAEWIAPLREAVTAEKMDPRALLEAEEYLGVLEWSFKNVPFGLVAGFGVLSGWFVSMLMRRFAGKRGETLKAWNQWNAPEWWIWVPIAAGALLLFDRGALRQVAFNALIPAVAVYFLQGLAIFDYLLEKWSLSAISRGFAYALVFMQLQLFGALLALFGAFDQWIDTRRRLGPRVQGQE